MSSPATRRVGRVALCYGLTWRLLATEDAAPIVWARAEARTLGTKFGVVQAHEEATPRVGLATQPGQGAGGYSAAVWLSQRVTVPTLAFEYLGADTWWICRVESGEVLTDVIETGSSALERLDTEAQAIWELDAHLTYTAPDERPWLYQMGERRLDTPTLSRLQERVKAITADELFAGEPPPEALIVQLVGIRPRTVLAMAIVAALGLGLYAGYGALQAKREAERQEAERVAAIAAEQEAARLATLREVRALQAVKQALAEDTRTVAPNRVIAGCMRVADFVGERYAGWVVDRIHCAGEGRHADVSLRLATGQTGFQPNVPLLRFAESHGHEVGIDAAANTARVKVPLPEPAARLGVERAQLPTLRMLQAGVINRLQTVQHLRPGTSVSFTAPEARQIQFVDPSFDNDPSNPARWVQVPTENGYTQGVLRLSGLGLLALSDLQFPEAFVTVRTLELQPNGAGDFNFQMETGYVSAAL